jgi:Flp pilus assembly protein TadD
MGMTMPDRHQWRRPPRWLPLALPILLALACAGPAHRDPGAIAKAYLDAGRVDEAVREVELAVRTHPTDVALRRQAGRIQARAGDLERAVAHLEVALSIAPNDADVSIDLGELEQSRENTADAYVAFRRAQELAPDDIRAVQGLALSAEALGFSEEAADAYARWAELERQAGEPVE